jgi:type II secretory pathway component PulF
VAIVFCAVPSALIFFAVPRFHSLFNGFGADLPPATVFLLGWRYLVWILPALGLLLLGVTLITPAEKAIGRNGRMVAAFAVLCCTSMLVEALALVALYAPIFRLGAVI